MFLNCDSTDGNVSMKSEKLEAWRSDPEVISPTVHMNVMALTLNSQGSFHGWGINQKTTREEKKILGAVR